MLSGYVYRKRHPDVEAGFLGRGDSLNASTVLGNREYQARALAREDEAPLFRQ